jgi:hypothetical protein
MKDPLNVVVSQNADGFRVQHVGLSAGQARVFYDGLCQKPPTGVTEVWLFEKLKAAKHRQIALQAGAPVKPATAPVVAKKTPRLPSIIRRGR